MGLGLCTASLAMCPFGVAPTPLTFLPTSMIMGKSGPMGCTTDCIPFLNIAPFGVCMSLMNPTTAALTAAAFGVLTPGPCIPTPAGTWLPVKPTVAGKCGVLLSSDSMLMCAYGGVIKATVPSQFTVIV